MIVRVRQLTIPPELLGRDYRHDAEFRAAIQHWIGQIWTQKDALIDQLLPPADRTAA